MPKYYKLYVNTGFVGARHEEIIEVPDGQEMPTPDEMEDIAKDYAFDNIEYGAYECHRDGTPVDAEQLTDLSE